MVHLSLEIYRVDLPHFYQQTEIVYPRLDKINFIKPRQLPLYIYMIDEQFLIILKVRKLIK